jgi:uncharacterized damage-inducible protein DinB
MIHTIAEFEQIWAPEMESTQKVLKHLSNASLSHAAGPEDRTLGRLAWHIVLSISEMMERTGLSISGPDENAPVPATAKEIFQAYSSAAISLLEQVKRSWKDETLTVEDDMYGERWPRSKTLQALIFHQIHHRAQMTVLMREAGLDVPGVYGPARQEWAAYGMKPPSV